MRNEGPQRDYRPRGATIGRSSSTADRRTTRERSSLENASARTRSGHIGRPQEDVRSSRIGRSGRTDRPRSIRIGRSSRDSDDRRTRRVTRQRSEQSTRARSGRRDTRERSTRSRSGSRERAERGSSPSGDKGHSRSRSGSNDNGERLRSDVYRPPSSSGGRIGRRTSTQRILTGSAREALPTRIQVPEYSARKVRLQDRQERYSSFQFETNDLRDFDRPTRTTINNERRVQRSQSDRQRASSSRSSSSDHRARSKRSNSSSRSGGNSDRSRRGSRGGNGR